MQIICFKCPSQNNIITIQIVGEDYELSDAIEFEVNRENLNKKLKEALVTFMVNDDEEYNDEEYDEYYDPIDELD